MARLLEFDEEQAIQKAMEIFWKQGYASTSMRDLTDAMQINSSSLYNTIGDKKQLFVKVLKHYIQMRIRAVEERYVDFNAPLQTLENFIRDAANLITAEPNSCLCIKATFETECNNSEVRAIISSYDNYNHQFLKTLIKNAQNKNEIPRRGSPEIIADHLISLFTGWYNSFAIHQDRRKILNMADFAIHQLKN